MSDEAVVLGSGPNGLAAAITLAEAGRPVTVLEAAGHIGGAVATEELTLPGFRHGTFSAVYPATAASPVFARWPLERHGLRWVHPRYCYDAARTSLAEARIRAPFGCVTLGRAKSFGERTAR